MSIKIEFQRQQGHALDVFDEIIKEVKVDSDAMKKQLQEVGTQTAIIMLAIIAQNKVRPQNGEPLTLEENIKVEFFEDGWGVGDLAVLNEVAPYWAAINFGSSHMVGKRMPIGGFSPGNPAPNPASFRQDRFVKGGGSYAPLIKNPIPPMNYIEKTIYWLNDELSKLRSSTKT